MVVFQIKTKAEAAKKIASVKQEFLKLSSNLNCRRLVPILLCLDDAVSNLMKDVYAAHRVMGQFKELPELYESYFEFLLQWYYAIDDIMTTALENGFDDSTTKIELPSIIFGINTDNIPRESAESGFNRYLEENKGKTPKNSKLFIRREADFLPGTAKAIGYYCLFLNSNASKHVVSILNRIIKLRDLYVQESWLNAMIYKFPKGVEAEFDDAGLGPLKIVYPKGFNHADLDNTNGLSTRFLDGNLGVYEWNSNLLEIATNNLKINPPKGLENLAQLRAEWQEVNKGLEIKGFPETFRKTYGITLEIFNDIMSELLTKCYNSNEHAVGLWLRSDVVSSRILARKFSAQNILQVIEILASDKIRKTKTPYILSIGNLILTNFRRLQEALIAFPQSCFDDFYEDGLKGPIFEEACRRTLLSRCNTVPNCVKINEPMLPSDVSIQLWRKQKEKTDLDVIAACENFLIILECKEIKTLAPREREKNQFLKYIKEMFWRTKWVSSNINKFREYVGNDWDSLQIDVNKEVTIIPLIVSNNLVGVEMKGYPPLITLNELRELLSVDIFVKPKEAMGSLNFRVGSKDICLIYMTE